MVIVYLEVNKKHSNATKPDFHAASAWWYIWKLLVLASWQGFDSPIDPKVDPHLCLDMTYPPTKFDVDCSKETQTSSFSKLSLVHYDIS